MRIRWRVGVNLLWAVVMLLAAWIHWIGQGGLTAAKLADAGLTSQGQAVVYAVLGLALIIWVRRVWPFLLASGWFLISTVMVFVVALEARGGHMSALRAGALWAALVLLGVRDGECHDEH